MSSESFSIPNSTYTAHPKEKYLGSIVAMDCGDERLQGQLLLPANMSNSPDSSQIFLSESKYNPLADSMYLTT